MQVNFGWLTNSSLKKIVTSLLWNKLMVLGISQHLNVSLNNINGIIKNLKYHKAIIYEDLSKNRKSVAEIFRKILISKVLNHKCSSHKTPLKKKNVG